VCPVCCKACLDTFGEHVVHWKELPDFKYKHVFVRDVLFNIFRRAGVSVKKEASVNFLTDLLDRISTLRPADVMVYKWVGGKHACVVLIGVSPLVGSGVKHFMVGQTTLKVVSRKVTKHEKECSNNQHSFYTICFRHFRFPNTRDCWPFT